MIICDTFSVKCISATGRLRLIPFSYFRMSFRSSFLFLLLLTHAHCEVPEEVDGSGDLDDADLSDVTGIASILNDPLDKLAGK